MCAVAGKIESMSNGESKIAIFKAALCYGFAIALRALFLGILCSLIATRLTPLAMTQGHVIAAKRERSKQPCRAFRDVSATRLALAMRLARISRDSKLEMLRLAQHDVCMPQIMTPPEDSQSQAADSANSYRARAQRRYPRVSRFQAHSAD